MKRKADKQQNSGQYLWIAEFRTLCWRLIAAPRSAVSAVAARRAKKARPSPDRSLKYATPSNVVKATEKRLAAPVKAVSADLAFELSSIEATEALKSETSEDGKIMAGDEHDDEEDTDARNNAE